MTPRSTPAASVTLFYSYSHKDEKMLDKLTVHLAILKRAGVITAWHDRNIGAGEDWKHAIDEHLDTAAIVLLLVSPDFVASDYCWSHEMTRALERHDAGEALVIPIILRPVDWDGAPFGRLQALPKDAKPITVWPNRDLAWVDVVRGIRDRGEWDTAFVNALRDPPQSFTFGGMVLHVLTFQACRRSELIQELGEFGIDDLGYGDPIEWERAVLDKSA